MHHTNIEKAIYSMKYTNMYRTIVRGIWWLQGFPEYTCRASFKGVRVVDCFGVFIA
jgi:hypothetical protein